MSCAWSQIYETVPNEDEEQSAEWLDHEYYGYL